MRTSAIVVAVLLTSTLLVALAPSATSAGTLRLMAVGDTGTSSTAQRNVDAAIAEGAQGFVGLGDYNYDSSVSTWKTMFQPLTSKAAYLAIGNHDDRTQFADLMPDGTRWSKSVNGVRIVALNGMSAIDTTRLRSDLCNAPESTRIVITHHNWWLGSSAHHPGSEFPTSASTMDTILKDCGVDLVLAGHEHNYQRMVRNGIDYVIAGTGGRGLYPLAGIPSGTVATYYGYGRVVLDLAPTGFSAQFKTLDGTVKDSFTSDAAPAPAPTPAPTPTPTPTSSTPTFTPKGGNEWWVQVTVSGAPTKVEARDTGASYVPLVKKSWGDWAASFHVEAGHDVQYRATFADGATYESCWYDHPATTCASGSTTPPPVVSGSFTATYRNIRGNAYWVETDVSVTGGTLHHVEARVGEGAWTPLDHKSWGSWAKSIQAPSGALVTFRSVAQDGQTSLSSAVRWPPAA